MVKERGGESWLALIRLSRTGELLYEGEVSPGQSVEVEDPQHGLRLEVLWIRHHLEPQADAKR